MNSPPVLQDALGGNSRTAMVVTVCPTTNNVDETLFALQFAARARNVSLGPAHRNVGAKNLLEEGKELRARLREAGRKKARTLMVHAVIRWGSIGSGPSIVPVSVVPAAGTVPVVSVFRLTRLIKLTMHATIGVE